ncbi:MAG: DoxX family membrane protein [bacterium]|nr:DoxX family membrane protein [bacterium]
MMRTFTPWLVLACRLGVGGVFLYAAWDKLLHPQAFAQAIHFYHLVPASLLHPWAHLLPVLEIVVGLALVLGLLQRGAALLAGGLTVVFMVAIAAALARGLDISCGCFHTDGGHGVGLELLVRDTVLLAACLPVVFARRGGPGLDDLRRH